MEEQEVGRVVDYFAKVGVAGINLTGRLTSGDIIHIHGHTTDFQQTVDSMQIEHEIVQEAKPGDSVGIRTKDRCRAHDVVYNELQ